jgi:hypothetical protein
MREGQARATTAGRGPQVGSSGRSPTRFSSGTRRLRSARPRDTAHMKARRRSSFPTAPTRSATLATRSTTCSNAPASATTSRSTASGSVRQRAPGRSPFHTSRGRLSRRGECRTRCPTASATDRRSTGRGSRRAGGASRSDGRVALMGALARRCRVSREAQAGSGPGHRDTGVTRLCRIGGPGTNHRTLTSDRRG